jgi:hypothetical protein
MNDRAATQPSPRTFDAAVRGYERRVGGKIQALMPHKKGIAELRSKQASFRTIAHLLKQAGVNVSHDTVARFCHEILEQPTQSKGSPKPAGAPQKTNVVSILKAQRETAVPPPAAHASRSRGPRIADPKNV